MDLNDLPVEGFIFDFTSKSTTCIDLDKFLRLIKTLFLGVYIPTY